MTDFQIRTAGRTTAVRCVYETTRRFCRGYLCEDVADFSVEITADDIAYEQTFVLGYSNAYLEIIALLRKISEQLIEYDTLLFHGSCIAVDGAAYLFTAPSGTGKSTHTRLWREMLGDRAVMVNDDKPFLRITDNGVLACGSPWNGKHRLDTNISVPLKAICILERGTENTIRQIPAQEALVTLFQQSCRPRDPRQIPRYMELLDRLSQNVSFYRMHCNMTPEAAETAYAAMALSDGWKVLESSAEQTKEP